MQAAEEADRANSQLQARKRELEDLQKNRDEITAMTEEVKKLKEQKAVFDELFAEKAGPAAALQYLSFMLQPRDEAVTPPEELKAMEAAGWRVSWDARKAWITSYRETGGEVTLQGRALDHEDVAEVARRLESSPYFREPKLVFQENKKDDRLGIGYVEFSIRASLVYQIEPLVKTPPKPEELAQAAAAQADASGGSSLSADATEGSDGGMGLIAPKIGLGGGGDGDAAAADAIADDAVDAAPDSAAAAPAKLKTAPPADKAATSDNDKAPVPAAAGAAEPPPAAAADKPPAAE
jgi:type IV pilus assembly protein PilN